MISDDESLLSAYLDGQLGPEEHQAVEAALLDDPRLAEELRDLADLRDLLAGLPRECPVDLTARVMRRVRRRAMLGRARGIVAWGPARAAGLAALAAGVLMMVAAPWFFHHHGVRRGGVPADRGPDVAAIGPGRPRPGVSEGRWPAFASRPPRAEAAPRPDGAAPPPPARPEEPTDTKAAAEGELARFREYLDHPRSRRIFLVSDPGDGSDERRVASVVERTTRFNFYKITISQGIVLDPRHPDEATVFALVVGPRELDSLRDGLRLALKERVREQPEEPEVVARLAEVGQVEACPPSPAAAMEIPREDLAFKSGVVGVAPPPAEPARAEVQPPRLRPSPEQERSSPAAEYRARKKVADESLVVLVWVSRPRRG